MESEDKMQLYQSLEKKDKLYIMKVYTGIVNVEAFSTKFEYLFESFKPTDKNNGFNEEELSVLKEHGESLMRKYGDKLQNVYSLFMEPIEAKQFSSNLFLFQHLSKFGDGDIRQTVMYSTTIEKNKDEFLAINKNGIVSKNANLKELLKDPNVFPVTSDMIAEAKESYKTVESFLNDMASEVDKVFTEVSDMFSIDEGTSEGTSTFNVSEQYIKSILENQMVINSMKVLKENHNKALVLLNDETSLSALVIVDTNNKKIDYVQYGILSKDVNISLNDKSNDVFWVIKSEVFDMDTYFNHVGLINISTLKGDIILSTQYPATMEDDWLSYSSSEIEDWPYDISKAYEIKGVNKNDVDGDGFMDIIVSGINHGGEGYITFYAKNKGFSKN